MRLQLKTSELGGGRNPPLQVQRVFKSPGKQSKSTMNKNDLRGTLTNFPFTNLCTGRSILLYASNLGTFANLTMRDDGYYMQVFTVYKECITEKYVLLKSTFLMQ